jgi:glycosyltransferase involved in cell wall biosynthesis
MKTLVRLFFKSAYVLFKFGPTVFLRHAAEYLRNKRLGTNGNIDRRFMDVLFINGCYLTAPSRYRVNHQKEQLFACNVISNTVFYTDIDNEMIKYYRVFILYRCPHTPELESFVKEAKEHNKAVLYDIDDLVIDKAYTDGIKYLDAMSAEKRSQYDDGVARMGKMLRMCDACITTTEGMAEELGKYVPEVFVNRNTVSDEMMKLSERAVFNRDTLPFVSAPDNPNRSGKNKSNYLKYKAISDERRKSGAVRMGYFSGSITHNDDIRLILPALRDALAKHKNLELHIVGELSIPTELLAFKNQIAAHDFVDWTKLPELIASVDINIAPLEDTVFNRAKSEIKWIEAALVKVPTIASKVGAFERMIENGATGLLCSTSDEWVSAIDSLIANPKLRAEIASSARKFAEQRCYTLTSGLALSKFTRSKMARNIMFVLPSLQISGGVLVVLKHAELLTGAGIDVTLLNDGWETDTRVDYAGRQLYVISNRESSYFGRIDTAVATLFTTVDFILRQYGLIQSTAYLVQGYETEFYGFGDYNRFRAQQTYTLPLPIQYITVSKWCQKWLKDAFEVDAGFAPNGLDTRRYKPHRRAFSPDRKAVVLIEGDSEAYYKNVDESFEIANQLDRSRFEVWYLSYNGKTKDWYKADKAYYKIPNANVHEIYQGADILLKSSWLESFSYPPLEMMATGGYTVCIANGGNVEYIEDRVNALLYARGDINGSLAAIDEIVTNARLQRTLYDNGLKTAAARDWSQCAGQICALYGVGESLK